MEHILLTLGPDHSQPLSHMRTFSHVYICVSVYVRDVGRVYKRGPSPTDRIPCSDRSAPYSAKDLLKCPGGDDFRLALQVAHLPYVLWACAQIRFLRDEQTKRLCHEVLSGVSDDLELS